MTRVALYTRVSTDRQEAENQRRQLRAFVKGHEGWKLVEEYRDEESGATGSRARFQATTSRTLANQRKFEDRRLSGSRRKLESRESTNRGTKQRWPARVWTIERDGKLAL